MFEKSHNCFSPKISETVQSFSPSFQVITQNPCVILVHLQFLQLSRYKNRESTSSGLQCAKLVYKYTAAVLWLLLHTVACALVAGEAGYLYEHLLSESHEANVPVERQVAQQHLLTLT